MNTKILINRSTNAIASLILIVGVLFSSISPGGLQAVHAYTDMTSTTLPGNLYMWSPSANIVMYWSRNQENSGPGLMAYDLNLYDAEKARQYTLASGGFGGPASFSRDGSIVSFWYSNIPYAAYINNHNVSVSKVETDHTPIKGAFSSSSDMLVYVTASDEIRLRDLKNNSEISLGVFENVSTLPYLFPEWSSDDRWVAFVGGSGGVLVNPLGQEQPIMLDNLNLPQSEISSTIHYFIWTQDNDALYDYTGTPVYSFTSNPSPAPTLDPKSVSFDGSYEISYSSDELFLNNVLSGTKKQLTSNKNIMDRLPPAATQNQTESIATEQTSIDGFDYPVGKPNGTGYNPPSTPIAGCEWLQSTNGCGPLHPGIDFNGNGGGDTDKGNPVYAVANGTVVFSGVGSGTSWGNIILIEHALPDGSKVWSQYAHLQDRYVSSGTVNKGDLIGTIGKGYNNNTFYAHLHFEIRTEGLAADFWPPSYGWSSTRVQQSYVNPVDYINTHRTVAGCNNPSPNSDQIGLYTDDNYCGTPKILGVGEYPNPGALGIANDSVSSIKVGSNVTATLCRDDNYFGGCEDFTRDDPHLGDNSIGNDSVSSAKVVTRPVLPPSDYGFCAEEGQRCSFSGTAQIYFGANNQFVGPRTYTDGVDCNNNVFGDPIPGTHKQCFIKGGRPEGSTFCANESGTCSFGTGNVATVYYGVSGKYYSKTNVASSTACDNNIFGDPFVGQGKSCYYIITGTSQPDLIPYPRTGRQDPIIVSSVSGTSTNDTLYAGKSIYMDWGFKNAGNADISTSFYVDLYIDNQRYIHYPYTSRCAGCTGGFDDWMETWSTPGWHTVKLVVDPDKTVAESNEGNNEWSKELYWTGYDLIVSKTGTGSGTVTSNPAGINCGSDCSESYAYNTTITLTATPTAGSTFTGWSGGCSGIGNCTVTIAAASTVTASFSLQQTSYTLNVDKTGTGSGTVISNPSGINCGSDCSETYSSGTLVTLTASTAPGSVFAGWSGGGCSGTSSCTVTVSAATTITAMFNIQSYTLTISKSGTGSGTVTSNPTGVNCGSDCSEAYAAGSPVVLTATAAAGSTFAGWSGAGCSGTGTCTVTLTANTEVTANFTVQTASYTLSVNKTGTGNGTVTSSPAGINCGSTCSYAFTNNTSVTLTAVPAAGSSFTGWAGAGCSGTGTCTVTMNAATSVTANFNLQPFTLTIIKTGTGKGTVIGSPIGIDCGSTCSYAYLNGISVTLTAVADPGSVFIGWGGSVCSGTGTCIVNMTASTTISANFSDTAAPTVSWVAPVGDGQVYNVANQLIQLEVSATDNIAINRIVFSRWDYVNLQHVQLGTTSASPYRFSFDTSSLLPDWNEIDVDVYDNAGNATHKYIWLNHVNITDTGLLSPTANMAQTGGDKNGYEVNPTNAYADDSVFAMDNNSGTGTSTSCTDKKKDSHVFYNYGINLPSSSAIQGIEILLDAKADSTVGSPKICIQLSWDGGRSWTTAKSTGTLTTGELTYILGSPTDTWGRTWTTANLSNTNFRVRIIDVASDVSRDFSLDRISIRVIYK